MKRTLFGLVPLLALALSLSACGGAGGDVPAAADTTAPAAVAEEPAQPQDPVATDGTELPFYLQPMQDRITINVGASFGTPEGAVPQGTTPENQTFNELVSEHMNIDINYLWSVPSAQGEERFQLAIATGEIPDFVTLGRRDFAEFSEFGMLRDLRDAYERYIHPGIREMFEYGDNVHLELSSADGMLLALPMAADPLQQTQLLWYRHDWMETLGLSVPRSMDDVTAMAVAFVENDMSGQGNTTGIGMQSSLVSGWMPDARGIFQGHGAYPGAWLLRNGELIPGTVQPEVQEALNTLRNMYALGALNPEFATMNMDQIASDIAADRVGIVFGEWWLPNWPFNSNLDTNPDADWRATTIVTPQGTPGITIHNSMNISTFRGVTANAPAGAEEAFVKMINLYWEIMYNPDALEIYGDRILPESGFVYNWVPARLDSAAFQQYRNYIMVNEAIRNNDPANLISADQLDLWLAHQIINEGYESDRMSYTQAWGLYVSRIARYGGWGLTMDVRDAGLFIQNEFYGDPTPTELRVSSILNDMWEEFAARYIMGDLPYEAWYGFTEDWWNLGGTDWAQEVNEQFSAMP